MIVINYGLPKSASSFVYQLTARILTAAGHDQKVIRKEYLPEELRVDGLPLVPEILRTLLDSVPAPSILTVKTHYPLPPLGDLVRHERVRAIVTVRDPRDAILSLIDFAPRPRDNPARAALMSKYPRQDGKPTFGDGLEPKSEMTFERALKTYTRHCQDALEWWRAPGFLKVTFAEIVDAPREVARRIAAHLGLRADRNSAPDAIDTDAIVDWFLADRTRIWQYSSGERSRYRRLMTPEQIEQCAAHLGPYIEAFGRESGLSASSGGKEEPHTETVSTRDEQPTPKHLMVGPEADFANPRTPNFFYVVAATPRSGSTFLCNELWRTGALGAPMEYFSFHRVMIAMIKRLQVDTFREYQEELLRLRTSPNGVFGFKAHFDQWEFFRIAGEFGRPVNLRFILIERRDIVAQAVSFSRALQTDRWGSNMVERKAKAYDFDHILDAMRELHRQLEGWRGWFPEQRITPLRVTYESLVTNPTDVIAGILSAFDKTADPGQGKSAPSTAPIADQTSREWIERFTKEGLERGILRRA